MLERIAELGGAEPTGDTRGLVAVSHLDRHAVVLLAGTNSARTLDLLRKRPIYACEGVPHLWLIEPVKRTLEAFDLHDGQWLLIASAQDDVPVNIHPFDAITFSLGELWD